MKVFCPGIEYIVKKGYHHKSRYAKVQAVDIKLLQPSDKNNNKLKYCQSY